MTSKTITIKLIISGIKYTLTRGDNIEDPITLMKNLRALKVTEYSGDIIFDSNSNSALNSLCVFSQARKNQNTGQYYDFRLFLLIGFILRLLIIKVLLVA